MVITIDYVIVMFSISVLNESARDETLYLLSCT